MRRRDVLAGLAVLPLSGCSALGQTTERPPDNPADASPPDPHQTPTLTTDLPIEVTVTPETPAQEQMTIEITVHNHGEHPFQMQENGLRLYKHVDGAWRFLYPKLTLAVYRPVTAPPGGSYTYELDVDNTHLSATHFDDAPYPTGARLGPGTYRMLVRGAFDRPDADSSTLERAEPVGTNVTIETAPLTLPLTTTMTVDDRARGTATVVPADTSPSEIGEVATLVVERTDRDTVPNRPPDVTAPIDQHLFTDELLNTMTGTMTDVRNALAAFKPITETVKLHTPDHSLPPFSLEPDQEVYAYYEGHIYRFTTDNWSWDTT